ncbi:MAG TPA: hypothetical protein PLV42_06540 [bacterium]|nr:hypothetical protein [bacterium]
MRYLIVEHHPQPEYLNDKIPMNIFADDCFDVLIAPGHECVSKETGVVRQVAAFSLTVWGQIAILDYATKEAWDINKPSKTGPTKTIRQGTLLVVFKDKTRKEIERVEYKKDRKDRGIHNVFKPVHDFDVLP